MALPPVTNTGITPATQLKPSARPVEDEKRDDKAKAASQQDTVSISEAALKKFDEIQSSDKARETAQDIRKDLERNPQVSLGYSEAV